MTTEREIVSDKNCGTGRPNVAASTRARARVPLTVSVDNLRALIGFGAGALRRKAGQWWVWTARPLSLRELWRASRIDPVRVPAASSFWTAVWRWSNRSDRLVMFAVIFLAPTGLTGPLRWIAARPTRRLGFYLLSAVFTAYVLL